MKKTLTLLSAALLVGGLWALGPDQAHGYGAAMASGPALGGGRELSEEQAKKLEALREAEKEEMKAARRKIRGLMDKLEDQVDAKATDGAIDATLKELDAAHKEMKAVMEKAKAAREALLTPTQRAKALLGHGHGMKGKHRGGHEGDDHGHDGPGEGREGRRGEGHSY